MIRNTNLHYAMAATLLASLASVGCDSNDATPAETPATANRAQTAEGPTEPASDAADAAVDSGPADITSTGRPKRRDGWWEMTSFHEDGAPRDAQSLCVGAGSEDDYNVFDQMTMFSECSRKDLTRAGAGWSFETRCDIGMNIISESNGTISGNFHDSFRVDLSVMADGSARTGSVRGEWKGACPADYKPGDLVDDDGKVLLNLLE